MTINEVSRHAVTQQRIEQALDDMGGRAFDRWHDMVWSAGRYGKGSGNSARNRPSTSAHAPCPTPPCRHPIRAPPPSAPWAC
ncbi:MULTISPECIES: hypothetical protein [unclassified Streptomyces]|uniref:hypothetical protein n=1 Tax=unclassified Streptomyces TaxID=2593676 RepID=UPI002E1FDE10